MSSQSGGLLAVIRKLTWAIVLFIVFAVAIPVTVGVIYGVPASSILSLILSTTVLQAAAPPLGLALGLNPPGILFIMATFAIGMVVAILEVCDSLALSSDRVKRWIDNIGKKMEKYPAIQKYGAVSCIAIAWVPGIGLYGTPIIAWILGWKRIPVIMFTTLGFVIASLFVLFFASRLSIEEIILIVAIVIIAVIILLAVRKYGKRKKDS
ncbi:MAG TPA: hypothetical protein VMW63_03765 [Methanoregulaceae archaeon]|nr:hypothetical protein [Methanoregulaceae archaeon]